MWIVLPSMCCAVCRYAGRLDAYKCCLLAQLAAERRRSAQLVDDLKRAKEENFLAVTSHVEC